MTNTTISVCGPEESTVNVEAWIDPQWPGLAIHKTAQLESGWDITHVPSGLRICNLPDEAKARAALPKVGKLRDWNRPADKLFANYDPATRTYDPGDPGDALVVLFAVKQKVRAIVESAGKRTPRKRQRA